jgi:cell division protein FtsA
METRYIAAVEIGSSKIKGTVAAVDATGGISVLAIEEADSGGDVRYGRVQNAREVSARVDEIIRRLENNPRLASGRITSVFIPEGGRSLLSMHAEASVRQGSEVEITAVTLDRLHNEARYNLATDRDVLEIAPRRYFVDNTAVKKVIGTFGNVVRGEFTIITASPENRRNLNRVKIEAHGVDLTRHYITRITSLADTVLSDSDRQLGCLLIDFGAETTTLALYRENALHMAATLPMGSANITRDLCSGLSITEEAAENIKITKGEAIAERVKLTAPDAETREIINLVSARAGEIIANIVAFVTEAGVKTGDLAAGIVLAGGGAKLKGFMEMMESQTKLKVRRAVADSSIAMLCGGNASEQLDVISAVRYAARRTNISCVEFPVEDSNTETTAPSTQMGVSPSEVPTGRRSVADDANLLKDDDFDAPIDQPDNINDFDPDELPKPQNSPEATRRTLIERFKSWIAPTNDDVDED